MHLVSLTSHPPSAVLYSLACSFQESDERYLSILTPDKLQIHALKAHEVELVCEQEIWGQPRGLIQLEKSKHLVVALDIPQARILILRFDPRSSKLSIHHTSIISPLAHRPSVNFSGILGGGQSLCASFYSGHVKFVEVDPKAPYEVKESDLRVHELAIQSMCYTLPSSDKLVAIVYTDSLGRGWIIGRTANGMDSSPMLPEKELEVIPETIIPVQIENPGDDHTYGVLLFASDRAMFIKTGTGYFSSGETSQSTKGKGKPKSSRSKSEVKADIQASMVAVDVPYRDVAAWTQVDGKHLMIGDSLGRLYLLTMSMEHQFTMTCTRLGDISVPSTLSYLSNNILYVGSLSGPSQLVRISDEITSGDNSVSRGKKKQPDDEAIYLEVMAEHNENIAPIWDATLVEIDGSGQPRIAIISGDESGGWLSVVHKGASFRELAILDGLGSLENVFPLKKYFDTHEHSYLVASTTTSTFILSLANSSVTLLSPSELSAISRSGTTVLASNVALQGIDTAIHVTSNNAVLLDLITGRGINLWKPPKGDITAAELDTLSSTLCVATSEGYLFSLNIQPSGLVKTNEVNFKSRPHSQISSLSMNARIVAVAFWGSNEIVIISLDNFKILEQSTMEEPSAASAVHLSNFGASQTYLIAARLDGAVVIQAITSQGELIPNSRRVVPLGSGPIHLATTADSSDVRVIAAGKHAATLSIINKRLSVSSLPVSDVCALAAVNAPGIGYSIVYASANRLVFGEIEQLNKLNISKFNLGSDTPLCLAHHPGLSNYAIGCVRPRSDTPEERHFIRFQDDSTFKDLGQHKLKYSEVITSIGIYAHGTNSYVLAGTAVITPGESEPLSGRIIAFGQDKESSMIKLQASKDVEGGVSSVKQLGARIIAAVGHGVYLYNFGNDGVTISNPVARWERGYLVHDIIVRPNMLVVSDKLRSVSVLRLVEHTELSDSENEMEEEELTILQFETVAMDMHAVWPTSIEVLSDNKTIIASQVDGNILTWELEDGNLEPRAAFHTGEVIHKFIASTARSTTGPRTVAIFVTSTGRIGTLSTVDDADALRLTRLEMKMGDAIKGLGDINHAEWRAPKHLHTGSKPPPRRGVTDGDFIKKFLELDPGEAKKILSAGSAAESIGPAEESQIRRCLDAVSMEQ
ncbi:CPSF A subunit region protein [Rhizoctonia solani AG-3 Rhs1AP]|uniref:CPSF A subunit region protein n=1 Tax=Rhizoctonia solani AG-3 Rhs1AP TaxID=1086054 RepID=X8JKF6_9AGAM|nr:CPSF A subunit region protein [Rhizoctonia solani AG-3 Rhs1AP]